MKNTAFHLKALGKGLGLALVFNAWLLPASVFASPAAEASALEACEKGPFMKALLAQALVDGFTLQGDDKGLVLLDESHGPILEVTCHDLKVPGLSELPLSSGGDDSAAGTSSFWDFGPFSLSRTARGAVSMSFQEGAVFVEPLELLFFDDQSVSLAKPTALLYQYATDFLGRVTEKEGFKGSCHCERLWDEAGHLEIRPLEMKPLLRVK